MNLYIIYQGMFPGLVWSTRALVNAWTHKKETVNRVVPFGTCLEICALVPRRNEIEVEGGIICRKLEKLTAIHGSMALSQ